MLATILIVAFILMLVAALPSWSHSRQWGYVPGGILGLGLVVVIILAVAGRL